MIKLQNLTPEVLYDQSRDFQLIGRLFDLVLNSVKTEVDMLYNLPFSDNSSDELLSLLTLMYGLKLDRNKYTSRQLRAICSVMPKLMKTKGSFAAVDTLCRALLRADSIVGDFMIIACDGGELNKTHCHLDIYMPSKDLHMEILFELLPYILPAGVTFTIKQENAQRAALSENIAVESTVRLAAKKAPQSLASFETAQTVGLFKQNSSATLEVISGKLGSTELATYESIKGETENNE